jgi:hypothetical protein
VEINITRMTGARAMGRRKRSWALADNLGTHHQGCTQEPHHYVLGPAPGVGVMAKGPQGWVKCEDRLPYYKR